MSERLSGQEFRELPSMELWSATISPEVDFKTFSDTVKRLSTELNEGFSGYITGTNGIVQNFTRTRYPRRKYGIPPIERLEVTSALLAQQFGIELSRDEAEGFRIVLGLLEGYDASACTHQLVEVQNALAGSGLSAFPAEVFASRPDGEGNCAIYTESCAIISGDISEIGLVYDLAYVFGQERFTIENFDVCEVTVVETPHCKNPDPLAL